MTTSDQYEEFIALLIENIRNKHRRISELRWGRNNNILGVSGQPHQIDVSFIDHDFEIPTLVIIECKRFNDKNPVELGQIKIVKATIDDIKNLDDVQYNVRAIIITTNTFQSGAMKFANYYGIITEIVPHDYNNYTFRYENLIQAGLTCNSFVTDLVDNELFSFCLDCGNRYKVQKNEKLCQLCREHTHNKSPS